MDCKVVEIVGHLHLEPPKNRRRRRRRNLIGVLHRARFCTTGGYYNTTSNSQAFLIAETSGPWGQPLPLPRLARSTSAGQ